MKTFICKKLGHDCSWQASARTGDLLLDKVAVHLREAHGTVAVFPDMLESIHRTFSGREEETLEEPTSDELELKEFRCADIGQKCDFRYVAMTEDLIADGAAVHAREAHGIKEFTPEMIAQVKKAIHVLRF